jgi:hypothetical protein
MKLRISLILVIGLLAAFMQFSDGSASKDFSDYIPEFEISQDQYDISPVDSHLNLPRQTNFTNTQSSYTNVRRLQNIGVSKTCILCKNGHIAAIQSDFSPKHSSTCYLSDCSDTIEHLILLGRLII